ILNKINGVFQEKTEKEFFDPSLFFLTSFEDVKVIKNIIKIEMEEFSVYIFDFQCQRKPRNYSDIASQTLFLFHSRYMTLPKGVISPKKEPFFKNRPENWSDINLDVLPKHNIKFKSIHKGDNFEFIPLESFANYENTTLEMNGQYLLFYQFNKDIKGDLIIETYNNYRKIFEIIEQDEKNDI
ncbi:hypothetical protein JXR93_11280, partial [bacterium]|nr:hypothetical protein [bacterium]